MPTHCPGAARTVLPHPHRPPVAANAIWDGKYLLYQLLNLRAAQEARYNAVLQRLLDSDKVCNVHAALKRRVFASCVLCCWRCAQGPILGPHDTATAVKAKGGRQDCLLLLQQPVQVPHLLFPLLYDGLSNTFALLFQLLQRLYAICQHGLLGLPAGPAQHMLSAAAVACLHALPVRAAAAVAADHYQP